MTNACSASDKAYYMRCCICDHIFGNDKIDFQVELIFFVDDENIM